MDQLRLIANYFSEPEQGRPGIRAPRNGATAALDVASLGFDPADSTETLQKAFDSPAEVILIPKMSSAWITRPLFINRTLVLIIEEGAELEAKSGAFTGTNEVLLSIRECAGVRVYGYGAVVRMHKPDYQNPPYQKGEWRHAIQILGSKDVIVAGVRVESSGGDGVYVGRGRRQITNQDIILRDLELLGNHRQGISVITAMGLLVENCVIRGTAGTPPSAGIDFEPNLPDEPIVNCRVKNCLISNNAGVGIEGYFLKLDATSLPFDITIEQCDIYDQFVPLFFAGFTRGGHGSLVIIDSDIRGFSHLPDVPELTVSYRSARLGQ